MFIFDHVGCPMKDLAKTSTAVKTRGQLDFSIKSYGQKTIFSHFLPKIHPFYDVKICENKMLRRINLLLSKNSENLHVILYGQNAPYVNLSKGSEVVELFPGTLMPNQTIFAEAGWPT